jgi:hypothetical protein
MKKGCGQLIHMLDFIKEENGQLIIHNKEGDVVKDVQHIIYSRVGGDAWWDYDQLLVQVDKAILIFEEAHPSYIILFVFDQSSAHASPRPDALHAFDINKLNGGRQKKQKDIIILMTNKHPKFCYIPLS